MATLYQGHVIDVLAQLPEESVNCVVTSPPYWGLRKYQGEQVQDWNNGVKCAYGLEPTIALYVQHTVTILQAIRRVLRKDGVCWWNVGDSYGGGFESADNKYKASAVAWTGNRTTNLKPKDLCLIPSRVALAAQDSGWWVRSMIVWSKPNPMPESVTDRPTDAYENIIMLTTSKTYWYDGEAVSEPAFDWGERDRTNGKYKVEGLANGLTGKQANHENRTYAGFNQRWDASEPSPTRNLRNVWEITTQPYKEAHFATFPEKIPERCILASCPQDGVVLEPFAGSGTTLAVAKRLGRKSIGIELSEQYCQLAIKRIRAVTLPMVTA
jgi:DNA modification methylase